MSFDQTGTPEYSQFIHVSRYARWMDEENRRETWKETVDRYYNFFISRFPDHQETLLECKHFIKQFKVMPSMRCLMTAGKALEKDEVAGFNCSYVAIDHQKAFDEILYILMCGTGVGFSVEQKFVNQLPEVAEVLYPTDTTIIVADSKIGWASSFRELLSLLYSGKIPKWDLSRLRPNGARLKTFGGRSAGPEPLNQLFIFSVNLFKKAAGRKLSSIECHDLVCKVADVVVSGGVRRSALLSLSDLSDDRMRLAKSGQWWIETPHRALSNNSVAYNEKPDLDIFLEEWKSLYRSHSGERGLFNRKAAEKQANKSGRRDVGNSSGCNPCSEIILKSAQFCNLSEVIIREKDTLEDLKDKVRIATILGTFQATLTNFRYLRKIWQRNTEEERLLGVSLTGIMDHPVLCCDEAVEWLSELKQVAIDTNKEWAEKLGIQQSTAITCVKPAGTVSQLTNTSSGIHPRYSKYYIRTVRVDEKDAVASFLKLQGVPYEVDKMKSSVLVFSFPIKSPSSAQLVSDVSGMEQLRMWKIYQDYWCEHKPSCTVYYTDEDFLEMGAWVWKNFDDVCGISFLPYSDHVYEQAPYQPCSEEQYNEALKKMPKIDWNQLQLYETEDGTTSTKELQCAGGVCEVVDIESKEIP